MGRPRISEEELASRGTTSVFLTNPPIHAVIGWVPPDEGAMAAVFKSIETHAARMAAIMRQKPELRLYNKVQPEALPDRHDYSKTLRTLLLEARLRNQRLAAFDRAGTQSNSQARAGE